MGKYVDFYCRDNNKELKRIVDPILRSKFRWIAQKDFDDFYSIAAGVVWECEEKFCEKKVKNRQFKSYLSSCIHNKLKSRMTYMHRDKRVLKDEEGKIIYEVSIDIPVDGDESCTLGDTLVGNFDIDKEVFDREEEYSEKMRLYLSRLSHDQKEVLKLIMEGYCPKEIKEELHMADKQYTDCYAAIHSYRNISVLF